MAAHSLLALSACALSELPLTTSVSSQLAPIKTPCQPESFVPPVSIRRLVLVQVCIFRIWLPRSPFRAAHTVGPRYRPQRRLDEPGSVPDAPGFAERMSLRLAPICLVIAARLRVHQPSQFSHTCRQGGFVVSTNCRSTGPRPKIAITAGSR
jgi:hypothetical protein